ncbi:hypothetical protein PTSG_05651 [Salpingoeca rosetta]|uniref:SAP domain-containing protein n=1 Tax=Salpingoeca rosetta (strain ATCC 50818 / BSB-021) TaxID=946362 RepID=F2UBU1_SALR5|nr:uncharacterized protein PTSG_05651 [Salpingoeca rosetta]EGD73957.1 hypothetical protein PTSG_05651 [Salpingoeca rosetta]|eukprot:XP_004993520.1 hypothetical protein PTSG_05651 [Salpingoeca rosetta]
MEDLDKMKVVDLRAKLKEKGLDTNGKKAELISRLKEHEEAELLGLAGDDSLGETEGAGDVDLNVDELDDVVDEDTAGTEAKEAPKKEAGKAPASSKPATATEGKKSEEANDESSAANTTDEAATAATDRRLARAARFGIETKETKKEKRLERAKRFGLETKEIKQDKRKQRAERFGLAGKGGSSPAVSAEAQQKRLDRAKRFGLDVMTKTEQNKKAKKSPATNKKNYAAMSVEELEKMKKRIARFNPDDTALEQINSALAAKASS